MRRDGENVEEQRMVNTSAGALTYTLARKKIKNMNLRVGRDLSIYLSVPMTCTAERADRFVQEKSGWLSAVLEQERAEQKPLLPELDQESCQNVLQASLDQVYPLVEPLGVTRPKLKIRTMTSQWGNCHWMQGYITLNRALVRCPAELRDYVALHELVHFLHHDHGKGFYGTMELLMPDWQERRRALRGFAAALEHI